MEEVILHKKENQRNKPSAQQWQSETKKIKDIFIIVTQKQYLTQILLLRNKHQPLMDEIGPESSGEKKETLWVPEGQTAHSFILQEDKSVTPLIIISSC